MWSRQPKYVELRTSVLHDYLVDSLVDPTSQDMDDEDGLFVKNINGKEITFESENAGWLM